MMVFTSTNRKKNDNKNHLYSAFVLYYGHLEWGFMEGSMDK